MLIRKLTIQLLPVCLVVVATALAATAQIGKRNPIKILNEVTLVEAADLDQCANGPQNAQVDCTGTAWQNGNLNQNQAHYLEGESVPYRLRITGLRALSTGNTVTIEWDTTVESGKHAIDYLTTYNRSEATADPCTGVLGCNPGITPSTYAIPIDPAVTRGADGILGTADDITQEPGEFALFGGTITAVSDYTVTGDYATASQTSITITFTANTPNVVLAWGGHISTRFDWGANHSAIAIPGSSYHMRLLDLNGSGGNQDRSLSNTAAVFPAMLTIIKDAEPEVMLPFAFAVTGQFTDTFSLWDIGYTDPAYPSFKTYTGITYFGALNQVIVTETANPSIFTLADILCTSDPHGGAGTNNNDIDLATLTVGITLEEGEIVTCTFVNAITLPTAAKVSIAGRVATKNADAVRNVMLHLSGPTPEETYVTYTNGFGYFRFDGVEVGKAYTLTISAKGYSFTPSTMLINLEDNIEGLDFIAIRDP